jgi:antitoxin YefM
LFIFNSLSNSFEDVTGKRLDADQVRGKLRTYDLLQNTWSLSTVNAISYSDVHANLASTIARVCEDHEALIITRNGQPSVVMLSLEDFTALEETAYLLRSLTNAKRLLGSIEQLNAGAGTKHTLTG